MSKDKTKVQLETELAASEAARMLAEKRLAIAAEALRDIRRQNPAETIRGTASVALTRMGNLRLRKCAHR